MGSHYKSKHEINMTSTKLKIIYINNNKGNCISTYVCSITYYETMTDDRKRETVKFMVTVPCYPLLSKTRFTFI